MGAQARQLVSQLLDGGFMKYRKLDANGDYQFGREGEFFIDEPDGVRQAIETRLLLMTNEWFLDSNEGTPYDPDILGYNTATTRDPAIIDRILGTPGVREILQYSSSVDEARVFRVNALVATIYGDAQIAVDLGTEIPTPPPPPSGPSTGWHTPLGDANPGTANRANNGTGNWGNGPDLNSNPFHASVVNYTTGVVAWSMDWQPVNEFQGTPTIEPGDTPQTVKVRLDSVFGPLGARGLLTVTATIDGNPVDSGVQFSCDDLVTLYPPCAWGPAP